MRFGGLLSVVLRVAVMGDGFSGVAGDVVGLAKCVSGA